MKIIFYTIIFLLSIQTTLCSSELLKKGNNYHFGEQDFYLTFNATNGAWNGLWNRDKCLIGNGDASISAKITLDNWKQLEQYGERKLHKIEKIDDNLLKITTLSGDIQLVVAVELFPSEKMAKFTYTVAVTAARTEKVRSVVHLIPTINWGKDSAYCLPAKFPSTIVRKLTGQKKIHWHDPNPFVVQIDSEHSMFFASDILKPYGDRGQVYLKEYAHHLSVLQRLHTAGWLKPGVTITSGDFWCGVVKGNLDDALMRFRAWQQKSKHVVLSDRPDWLYDAIMYSFHPGGTIGHAFTDWGGFVESTGRLSRLKDLNCNLLWILPVEDECCYIPDDYYKMQEGIGTPEEYKKMVSAAHKLGFRVWQDLVSHGGTKNNERAQKYPHLLLRDEKGNIPGTRAFDYNHSEWQKYLSDWANFFMTNYAIDGFRLDAMGGSHIDNWSPRLPYSRASMARGQGGLNMIRAIRKEIRKNRPDGALVSEIEGSAYGAVSDIVYDLNFALRVVPQIRTMSPQTFVSALNRWLWEQQMIEPENIFRLRYIASQDLPDSSKGYGVKVLPSLMALAAWLDGIPMMYKEMEEGNFDKIKKIIQIRQALPELRRGVTDYRSCIATPGVFTCLRQYENNTAIPVINFNPEPVSAKISIPNNVLGPNVTNAYDIWNNNIISLVQKNNKTEATVTLPGYGFTVLRIGNNSQIEIPKVARVGGKCLAAEAWLLTEDGSRKKINWTPKQSYFSTMLKNNTGILIRIPLHGEQFRYRITHAGGVIEDTFRTRHPSCESLLTNLYTYPLGGNILWTSLYTPLGLDRYSASIALFNEKSSIQFDFSDKDRPGAVFLLDRLDDDHNPYLLLTTNVPGTPIASKGSNITFLTKIAQKQASDNGSGDSRLIAMAGGWRFDNGVIRLRIGSGGHLVEAQRKDIAGNWITVFQNMGISLEGGYTNSSRIFTALNDFEAFSCFERSEDGTLTLKFFGHPRGCDYDEIFDYLQPNTVDYAVTYTLNNSGSFGYNFGIRPLSKPWRAQMILALNCQLVGQSYSVFMNQGQKLGAGQLTLIKNKMPDMISIKGDVPFSFTQVKTFGVIPKAFVSHDNKLQLIWNDDGVNVNNIGSRRSISYAVNLLSAPVFETEFNDINTRVQNTQYLIDPSFEIKTWNAWALTARGMLGASAWILPTEATLVPEFPVHGKQSLKIIFKKNENRFATQRLVHSNMKQGEVWCLSASIKGENIDGKAELRFSNPSTQLERRQRTGRYTRVILPKGSFEHQEFQVKFTVPSKWDGISVEVGGNGNTGTLWIDDVKLHKIH